MVCELLSQSRLISQKLTHIPLCCPNWFPYGPIYTLLYFSSFTTCTDVWGWNVSGISLITLPTHCKFLSQFLPHSCGSLTPLSDICNKCFPDQSQLGTMATTLQPSLLGLPYSGITTQLYSEWNMYCTKIIPSSTLHHSSGYWIPAWCFSSSLFLFIGVLLIFHELF